MTALDNNTGAVLWIITKPETQIIVPTIGADDTVYIGGGSGMVYAYEGATGNLRWIHAADTTQVSGLALGTDGTVYAAAQRGVHALNG